MSKTKVCSECKQELDVSEFYPRRNTKIGLSCCCKTCHKKRGKIAKAKIQAKPKSIPDTKKCTKCGKTYPSNMFNKDNDRICGLTSWCKNCIRDQRNKTLDARHAHDKKYYAENKERFKAYAKKNASHIRRRSHLQRSKNKRRYWSHSTLNGHSRRGFKISITIDELHEIAKRSNNCPICGIDLRWNNGKTSFDSPTLDRIDNENEIRSGNIWILCHRCNTMKRDLPMKEYVEHCKMVVSKFGNIDPANEVSA